jgi:N-methylhydantoinase A
MHGAAVGRRLGCKAVLVPRLAGAFCALGMLNSDVRQDHLLVFLADLDTVEPARIAEAYAALVGRGEAGLAADGFSGAKAKIVRQMDLRYRAQQTSIRVDVGDFDPVAIRAAFDAEHERQYGHIQPGGVIEISGLRVLGIGVLDPLRLAEMPAATAPAAPFEHRNVWLDETAGWGPAAIYRGIDLAPGHELAGPLLVEEATTTLFVGAGDTLRVAATGDYLIELGGRA